MAFEAVNPQFEAVVRESFARQSLMSSIGAELTRVAPGEVTIELPFGEGWGQQDGFLHAGVVASIADSACGYAAQTLMPEGKGVLTVEFKVNLLAPAAGERFVAAATVLRAGRTLTVVRADVHADGKLVATMLGTMIAR
ncbi:MAG TPA: PaaI family thioesterase [Thermoanaerobaculia bacterium]|nr:PaaI family thioesterase [Thermoanaerobaculia bacterium]